MIHPNEQWGILVIAADGHTYELAVGEHQPISDRWCDIRDGREVLENTLDTTKIILVYRYLRADTKLPAYCPQATVTASYGRSQAAA